MPVCKYYGICGGCSLQHIPWETQIQDKTAALRDTFSRAGFSPLPEISVKKFQPYGYRNRIQLHRDIATGKIGFAGRSSNTVVEVDDCPVACDTVREALKTKSLRPPPDKDRFSVYGRGDTLLCEGGRERGVIDILGRTLRIDAGVFFQSNGALLETLITELRALAGETAVPDTSRAAATVPDTSKVSGTGNAADFYCGVGTFAVFLADMFQAIDLVEENTAALALARENLRMPTAAFFAMSADKWVKSVSRKRPPYRFIVVDPPRAGLSKTMCGWLRANPPETLAYVSCDYRSLARNAQALTGGGLKLDALTYYDFYPQTPHIETLAVFRKQWAG